MGDQLDYDFQPIGLFIFFNLMLTIRDAISEDAALIRALIQELAEYDGEADQVRTTEADIATDGRLVFAWRNPAASSGQIQRQRGISAAASAIPEHPFVVATPPRLTSRTRSQPSAKMQSP